MWSTSTVVTVVLFAASIALYFFDYFLLMEERSPQIQRTELSSGVTTTESKRGHELPSISTGWELTGEADTVRDTDTNAEAVDVTTTLRRTPPATTSTSSISIIEIVRETTSRATVSAVEIASVRNSNSSSSRETLRVTSTDARSDALPAASSRQLPEAYLVVTTNDKYCLGAVVALEGVFEFDKVRDRVCLVTSDVGHDCRLWLHSRGIKVIEVARVPVLGNIKIERWREAFTSVSAFGLLQYSKVVGLGADVVVMNDLSAVFRLPFSPAVTAYVAHNDWSCTERNSPEGNSGLILYKPSPKTMAEYMRLQLEYPEANSQQINGLYHGNTLLKHFNESYHTFVHRCACKSAGLPIRNFRKGFHVIHFAGGMIDFEAMTTRGIAARVSFNDDVWEPDCALAAYERWLECYKRARDERDKWLLLNRERTTALSSHCSIFSSVRSGDSSTVGMFLGINRFVSTKLVSDTAFHNDFITIMFEKRIRADKIILRTGFDSRYFSGERIPHNNGRVEEGFLLLSEDGHSFEHAASFHRGNVEGPIPTGYVHGIRIEFSTPEHSVENGKVFGVYEAYLRELVLEIGNVHFSHYEHRADGIQKRVICSNVDEMSLTNGDIVQIYSFLMSDEQNGRDSTEVWQLQRDRADPGHDEVRPVRNPNREPGKPLFISSPTALLGGRDRDNGVVHVGTGWIMKRIRGIDRSTATSRLACVCDEAADVTEDELSRFSPVNMDVSSAASQSRSNAAISHWKRPLAERKFRIPIAACARACTNVCPPKSALHCVRIEDQHVPSEAATYFDGAHFRLLHFSGNFSSFAPQELHERRSEVLQSFSMRDFYGSFGAQIMSPRRGCVCSSRSVAKHSHGSVTANDSLSLLHWSTDASCCSAAPYVFRFAGHVVSNVNEIIPECDIKDKHTKVLWEKPLSRMNRSTPLVLGDAARAYAAACRYGTSKRFNTAFEWCSLRPGELAQVDETQSQSWLAATIPDGCVYRGLPFTLNCQYPVSGRHNFITSTRGLQDALMMHIDGVPERVEKLDALAPHFDTVVALSHPFEREPFHALFDVLPALIHLAPEIVKNPSWRVILPSAPSFKTIVRRLKVPLAQVLWDTNAGATSVCAKQVLVVRQRPAQIIAMPPANFILDARKVLCPGVDFSAARGRKLPKRPQIYIIQHTLNSTVGRRYLETLPITKELARRFNVKVREFTVSAVDLLRAVEELADGDIFIGPAAGQFMATVCARPRSVLLPVLTTHLPDVSLWNFAQALDFDYWLVMDRTPLRWDPRSWNLGSSTVKEIGEIVAKYMK